MKETIIKENESGQRLDKYLKKYLPQAPGSFIYKMLRKKNITLNGKKAAGQEKLKTGDSIKFFLAEETIDKFTGNAAASESYPVKKDLEIIYEDDNILLINKPAGMLSQKSVPSDVSLNEYLLGYLEKSGQWELCNAFVRQRVVEFADSDMSGVFFHDGFLFIISAAKVRLFI